MVRFVFSASAIVIALAILVACSSGSMPQTQQPGASSSQSIQIQSTSGTSSVLKMLAHEQTVGSAVNPVDGAVNPYGLDIAKVTSGKIRAGDLVVCDFN